MKFNELLERMRRHNEKLDEQFGEIMADDEVETISIDRSLEGWVDYLAQRFNDDKAESAKCRDLAAKYLERASRFDNAAEYRRQGLFVLIELAGKTIKTAAATVFKSKAQTSLRVDEAAVPEGYTKVVRTPDKAAIKKALEDGLQVNWASIEPGREYVVVRM